jgi:hypothetical protein
MFELKNPHPRRIECTMGRPHGIVVVEVGEAVPSPKHKAKGITLEMFEPFQGPSFLVPTPPAERRSLLQGVGAKVPTVLADATAHLPQFQPTAPPAPLSRFEDEEDEFEDEPVEFADAMTTLSSKSSSPQTKKKKKKTTKK